MTTLLFLFIALLQTALIYYQHFSPFERESNLRAVLWGAKPAPRYWAVLVLDVCTGLLIALLVLSLLPYSLNEYPLARLTKSLPVWVIATLLAAVLHSHVNHTIIRFPNYALMARRAVIELLLGAFVVAATLCAVALAIEPGMLLPESGVLFKTFPVAFAMALLVSVARTFAFSLRVIPVVGSFLHAVVSTYALVWTIEQYYHLVLWTRYLNFVSPIGRTEGIETIIFAVAAIALAALLVAWQLKPAKHANAVEVPALVVGEPEKIKPTIAITETDATIASAKIKVSVSRSFFGITATDHNHRVLFRLPLNGLTRDRLWHSIVSIPVLYTGNTMKMKWRVASYPIHRVTRFAQENDMLVISLQGATVRLSFHTADILRVTVEATVMSPLLSNALSLTTYAPDGSHYLGTGQRFNKLDQKGQDTYFFVEEGGVGYEWTKQRIPILYPILKKLYGALGSFPNGEQCTGFPVPFLLTCRASKLDAGLTTGLFVNSYQPMWMSIGITKLMPTQEPETKTRVEETRVTVLGNQLDLFVCAGPTPLDTIRQYASLTGKSATPPPWSFLPWKTNTGAVVENDVRTDIRKFRELEIPLAHVGIEHWQEIRGSYEFSKQWYPHIDDLVDTAHANGMHITVWHFPYMNAGSKTHREGVQRGYFLRNRLGLPYQQRIFHGIATVIDYTNPHAAAWHEEIVKRTFYCRGMQGAMTDYAESVPPDCVCYNGKSGLEMRNAYPVMYCESMQRAAVDVLGNDHILYPRAGYTGSQRFVNMQWPGDQDTDWDDGDGLPAAVRAMLNASICGFPVHGSDIGGWYDWFAPITTKELYLRWAEVGCYSPLMRAHGGPIGRNREPWKFDDETVQIYRTLSEEHVKLFPYLYSLAKQATRDGTPIIRHPALIWSDCSTLYEIEDAWMIGDALYAAPVVRQGQTRREVITPPGEWWDLTANCPRQGNTRIIVDAPLGKTPVFLRRGFIVPRFVKAFDTFDKSPASPARVGSLDDDIEAWIYPNPDKPAPFELFDGMTITEGEQPRNRKVTWTVFG